MSKTPSHRRKEGREAFEPGVDPMDVQPYKKGTWSYDFHLQDFLDGWKEAEIEYKKIEKIRSKSDEDLITAINILDITGKELIEVTKKYGQKKHIFVWIELLKNWIKLLRE